MRRTMLAWLAAALALGACREGTPEQAAPPSAAGAGGGIVIGPDSGVGAQICATLSPAEIAALTGSAVGPGQVTGPLGSACAWDFETTGIVLVQVMTPDYWDSFANPSDSRHRELTGVGAEAFVQPGLVSGWAAGALFADRLVVAEVTGPTSSGELAEALLRGVVGKVST